MPSLLPMKKLPVFPPIIQLQILAALVCLVRQKKAGAGVPPRFNAIGDAGAMCIPLANPHLIEGKPESVSNAPAFTIRGCIEVPD